MTTMDHNATMADGDKSSMSIANQRIPVQVTTTEKTQISKLAKKAGLSVGEFMRRAAKSYNTSEDEKALNAILDQMLKATDRAEKAIDNTIKFVDASNKRIQKMEAQAKKKTTK